MVTNNYIGCLQERGKKQKRKNYCLLPVLTKLEERFRWRDSAADKVPDLHEANLGLTPYGPLRLYLISSDP